MELYEELGQEQEDRGRDFEEEFEEGFDGQELGVESEDDSDPEAGDAGLPRGVGARTSCARILTTRCTRARRRA